MLNQLEGVVPRDEWGDYGNLRPMLVDQKVNARQTALLIGDVM